MSGGRRASGVVVVAVVALLAGACTRGGGSDGLEGFGGGTADAVTPIGEVAAATPEGGLSPPSRRLDVNKGQVLVRPWQERATPDKPWPATVKGVGDRVALTPAQLDEFTTERGRIINGFPLASFRLDADGSNATLRDRKALLLPNGTRWHVLDTFTVDKADDLPFSHATANGDEVVLVVAKPFGELVTAGGQVTARGRFETADGRRAEQLVLPKGTKAVESCPATSTRCSEQDIRPTVTVRAVENTTVIVDSSRDTEVAVAGTAEGKALGRTWTGLVGAVQGRGVKALVVHGEHGWSLVASTTSAIQLWIDVWPMADTKLSASVGANDCDNSCSSKVRWTNTGHASSQIFIAEGSGPGAGLVRFDLNESRGHDAGLGLGRGDRVLNLSGGGDIDSNLAPGEKVDRDVSRGQQPATIVLRGNFPEIRLDLS